MDIPVLKKRKLVFITKTCVFQIFISLISVSCTGSKVSSAWCLLACSKNFVSVVYHFLSRTFISLIFFSCPASPTFISLIFFSSHAPRISISLMFLLSFLLNFYRSYIRLFVSKLHKPDVLLLSCLSNIFQPNISLVLPIELLSACHATRTFISLLFIFCPASRTSVWNSLLLLFPELSRAWYLSPVLPPVFSKA